MKSIPPMEDLFNMAGMQLPDYLAKHPELTIEKNDGKEGVEA